VAKLIAQNAVIEVIQTGCDLTGAPVHVDGSLCPQSSKRMAGDDPP
jgi:hypothetical protein